jgi:hypothetical protein
MARKKYIYHHFVDCKEVTKEEFLKELQPYCMRCDTNYENPFLNISYLDTKLLQRKYNYHKCHPKTTMIYMDDERQKSKSFRIKREEK